MAVVPFGDIDLKEHHIVATKGCYAQGPIICASILTYAALILPMQGLP